MISILIPCQEDSSLLFPTVDSIFKNRACGTDFEVLLIRSSGFLVSQRISEFQAKVFSGDFRSQAQALNWGLERAQGNIICITKPGCVVASNWLSEISKFLRKHPEVQGVGGPVLPSSSYGTRIQRLASIIFCEEQGFPDSIAIIDKSNWHGLLHATNCAFRCDAIRQIGFDESFDYDYDFEICWKMLHRNNCLAHNPRMKVMYIFPSSMRDLLRRYYSWGKEKVILEKRHPPRSGFVSSLYPPYIAVRGVFEPSAFISSKKLLRFVQHLAFNVGCIGGYGSRASVEHHQRCVEAK